MTTIELLSYLRNQDVRLWVERDQLHCDGSESLFKKSRLIGFDSQCKDDLTCFQALDNGYTDRLLL
jgi:hypothetical protein